MTEYQRGLEDAARVAEEVGDEAWRLFHTQTDREFQFGHAMAGTTARLAAARIRALAPRCNHPPPGVIGGTSFTLTTCPDCGLLMAERDA